MASALELISVMRTDTVFHNRVSLACELLDVECTATLQRQVAMSVVASVKTDGYGNADTTSVTDGQILTAIGNLTNKQQQAQEMTTLLPTSIEVTTPSFGVAGDADDTVLALQAQIDALTVSNRVLGATVAAYEGDAELATSLLTGDRDPEPELTIPETPEPEEAEEPAEEPELGVEPEPEVGPVDPGPELGGPVIGGPTTKPTDPDDAEEDDPEPGVGLDPVPGPILGRN